MIISIHQPAYLPWLGYFHKIMLADIFVFFDTTQFEKNSFINRNKIKTPQGGQWLTVPVKLKGHLEKRIDQIEIFDQAWQKDHWKVIELNYKKAKYWQIYSPRLHEFYQKDYGNIAEACFSQLKIFAEILGLETKMVKASGLKIFESKKDELVLDICRELKADAYVSGNQGKGYLDAVKFEKDNIKVYFQDYQHPSYSQLWGEFIPCLSVLDLILNEGPKSKEIILKNNINKEELYEPR
ncbi:WbqC family protein [Candidatus Falkowbacteria bacterium]|nr:WbqC family protein [Candidatus Falkowbacteria bacterium]